MVDDPDDVGLAATTPSQDATVREGPSRPTDVEATRVDASPPAGSTPQTIGRFVVERELGSGGMGVVLLAHDPTLDRHVAIKLLRGDGTREVGSAGRVRLLREAEAMARLRHANVVTVYETGVHEGRVYLALEYISGGTLRDWLAARGIRRRKAPGTPRTIDTRGIVDAFAAAGRGLAAAHAAGIIHRDFKPENALVDHDGVVKVTDFGLAAARDDEPVDRASSSQPELDALSHTLTRTGEVMGTPRYMAPEQHAAKPTDARTDQFSFAVAVWEAVYGQHPFSDESYSSLRESVLAARVRPPPDARDVPDRIRRALERGFAHEPRDRFASIEDLLRELAPPAVRSRRWIVPAVGAAVATASITFVALRGSESPQEIALAAARACDCELVTVELPPTATLVGLRAIRDSIQPTGQLAIPRGEQFVDYIVDGTTYSYGVVSRGNPEWRTITLPTPERIPGFVFIPGGEVLMTDIGGPSQDQPPATVELAPYSIAIAPAKGQMTFAEARRYAFAHHARLPTAAEWTLAWRPVVLESVPGWEWTSTAFAPYPYARDGRDHPFAVKELLEVRGGGTQHGFKERRAGRHTGHATVRLAKSPRSPAPASIEIAMENEVYEEDGKRKLREMLPDRERARLDAFLLAWIQLADRPPLQLENAPCQLRSILYTAGIPADQIETIDNGSKRTVLRIHPDRTYRAPPGRVVICDTETELLDQVCFDNEQLVESSNRTLDATASTVGANADWSVEIQSYVSPTRGDAVRLARARAELVRAALIARGVAAKRLVATGHAAEVTSLANDLFAPADHQRPCPHALANERIVFHVLR